MITPKAANGYHLKTGQWSSRPGLRLFYPAAPCGGKSVFIRRAPADRTSARRCGCGDVAGEQGVRFL